MKKMVFFLLVSPCILMAQSQFYRQGHRGCRGLMPENTVAAMIKALDLGVTTLEMDVVISEDKMAHPLQRKKQSRLICISFRMTRLSYTV